MKTTFKLILCSLCLSFNSFAQQKAGGEIVIINQFSQDESILLMHYNSLIEANIFENVGRKSSISIPQMMLKKAMNFNFCYTNKQILLYAFPTDTIYVCDGKTSRYLFKGKRANEWNFMANLEGMGYPLMGFTEWNFRDVPYDNYLETAIKKRDKILNYVDSVKDSLQFSPEFTKLLKRDLESSFLKSLLKNLKKYSKPDTTNYQKIVAFTKGYESFFLNDSSRNSWPFHNGLSAWNTFLAPKDKQSKPDKKSATYSELLGFDYGENFKNRFELAKTYTEPTKSEMMYELITYKFLTDSWEDINYEPYTDYFLKYSTDSAMVAKVASISGTYFVKIDPTIEQKILTKATVLATKLTGLNGKSMSWRAFLDKYKGKTVYLDFWASWCGPCRQEIIKSKPILNQVNDPNIVFVNISVDEEKDKWKKAVQTLNMQTRRDNYVIDLQSALANVFNASKLVPQHAIIDKTGHVRTLDAPPPSSMACKKILDKLSKEL